MSSAVRSLQSAISEGRQSLTPLLRQTKLIAAKLNLPDVEKWVDKELRGYPTPAELPPYRKVRTLHIEIFHPYNGWQLAGNLSLTIPVMQPISEVENLSRGETATMNVPKNFPVSDSTGLGIAKTWPQRVVITGSEYKCIVEAVTDELLQWSIELEKRGIEGNDMNFEEKEKQSAGNMVFNIGNVQGNVGNVSNSQVTVCDYSSVHTLLIDRKVPMSERHELEEILEELKAAPPKEKPSLLQKGMAWITKNREFLGTSAEIVSKAIKGMTQ
jgi:hypothetical protein